MAHDNERLAQLLAGIEDGIRDFDLGDGIHRSRGLIQDHYPRLFYQDLRHGNPVPLALGELMGHLLQHCFCLLF